MVVLYAHMVTLILFNSLNISESSISLLYNMKRSGPKIDEMTSRQYIW